jgi:ribonuclease D
MTQSTDTTNHRFDPMTIPGLSRRARETVNAAFEAMSDWRSELADNNEKNIKRVIEKMAAAAAELGWPEQVVDAARTQLQNLTEMQMKTMDQMMAAWEAQLKLPDPAAPSAALNKMKAASGSPGSWPADAFQMGMTTPLQFWMSFAGQWQKSWADMMTTWTKAGKSSDNDGGGRRH